MLRLLVVAFLTAVPVITMPSIGRADPYRWCAVYSDDDGGGGTNCGFVTLAQCRATVSGIGGFCEPNRFYTGPAQRPAKRARKHKRG